MPGALWPAAEAGAAADEALVAALSSAGVETSAEALAARVSVLRASAARGLSARQLRVGAVREAIEHQLLRDGLDPAKLHLIGGTRAGRAGGVARFSDRHLALELDS